MVLCKQIKKITKPITLWLPYNFVSYVHKGHYINDISGMHVY